MTALRPFRFGAGPAGLGPLRSGREWRNVARRTEDLGYTALCIGEHIDGRAAPGPAAAAVAAWTDTLRVAVHMYANDFRHPGVLAGELSTLAALSDGRFDAGLGAGWMTADYERLQVQFDRPGTRIDRVREAAELIRACWERDEVTLHGTYYDVERLPGTSQLGTATAPRLVMGGGGQRMLTVAAQVADVVSVNVRLESGHLGTERGATATRAATERKLEVVRSSAGSRFASLELQVELHHVEITSDRAAALARAAAALGMSESEAEASPHVLVGSVSDASEKLEQLREVYGFTYFCLSAVHLDEFAPVVANLSGR